MNQQRPCITAQPPSHLTPIPQLNYNKAMRNLACLLATALTLLAQSTSQTAPMPNPYGASSTAARPSANTSPSRLQRPRLNRGRSGLVGGAYLGGNTREVFVEIPTPVKEDPLKDLVISPVYQRDKISPKMIEIP